jgi:hypothetical protein
MQPVTATAVLMKFLRVSTVSLLFEIGRVVPKHAQLARD